jgi:hypothetical protein
MASTRSPVVRAVHGILFVIAISGFVWLLDKIGWGAIGAALRRIGPWGACVIIALGFIENLLDACALRGSLRRPASLFSVGLANGTGALINALLPWEMGEVAKGALLQRTVASRDAVSATIISNYAFKLSRPLLTTSAALVALVLGAGVDTKLTAWVVAANALGFVPFIVLRLLVRYGMAEALVRLLARVRLVRGRHDSWLAAAQRLDEDVRSFEHTRPARFWLVVGAQVGARFTAWMSVLAAVRLMGLDYSFGRVALVYSALNVAEFIITILPVRLGVAEGAAFGVFALFGLDPATGVILYVVLRLKALISNAAWLPFMLLPVRRRAPDPDEVVAGPREP